MKTSPVWFSKINHFILYQKLPQPFKVPLYHPCSEFIITSLWLSFELPSKPPGESHNEWYQYYCSNFYVFKYAHLLSGVVRDYNVDDTWAFVCSLYGIGDNDIRCIGDARHSLFVKAKHDLDVLPPTHGALELHITRAIYQAKIWLQVHVIMDLENKLTETIDLCQEGTDWRVVWKCLLAIRVVFMHPVSCLCKTKCMSMRCKCSKAFLKCISPCRFDVIGFPNLIYST